jgi:hypothetical protein
MGNRACSGAGWILVMLAILTLFGFGRLDWLAFAVVISLLLACVISGGRNHARRLTKGPQKG